LDNEVELDIPRRDCFKKKVPSPRMTVLEFAVERETRNTSSSHTTFQTNPTQHYHTTRVKQKQRLKNSSAMNFMLVKERVAQATAKAALAAKNFKVRTVMKFQILQRYGPRG